MLLVFLNRWKKNIALSRAIKAALKKSKPSGPSTLTDEQYLAQMNNNDLRTRENMMPRDELSQLSEKDLIDEIYDHHPVVKRNLAYQISQNENISQFVQELNMEREANGFSSSREHLIYRNAKAQNG